MNIKHLTLLFVAGSMLSGCDKTSSSNCSSELAHKSLSQQIIEQVTKLTADEKYSDKDEYIFEKSKIRATVDQIKIVVEDVRTTEKDPNSSQQFCSGTLKITVPTNVLSDADQARELENRPKISQDARRGDIDDNLNVFTKKDFTFNIQPTDDGDKLYVKSEGAVVIEDFLHRVVASALWKPELEKRKAQMDIQKAAQSQQTQQEKQNIENLKHEAETSKLETERLMAEQEKQEAENLKIELLEKQTTKQSEQNTVVEQENQQDTQTYKKWTANWGNGIIGTVTTEACQISKFASQGYNYSISSSIPIDRLKQKTDAWQVSGDRAITVLGCWLKKDGGVIHAKLKRKKDDKTWEQDFKVDDGSWELDDGSDKD
ncbi:MAG: hypothetical protein QX189_02150 [Methylococcales bacterium]